MGGSTGPDPKETASQFARLSTRLGDIGLSASKAGTAYESALYKMGGADLGPKYEALGTDVFEATAGRPIGGSFAEQAGGGISDRGLATAVGQSGVATQKALSGVDEINKIRSVLSSQGLKTTALGAEASGATAAALSMVPQHAERSAIFAGLGLGSSIYGAFNQPTGGTPPSSSAASLAYSQSMPLVGSDIYYKSGIDTSWTKNVSQGLPPSGYFTTPSTGG